MAKLEPQTMSNDYDELNDNNNDNDYDDGW